MGIVKGPTVGSSGEYWSMRYYLEPALCGDDRFIKIMKAKAVVKSIRRLIYCIYT